MNNKAQELELRNIMEGLEEFATFMSFKGNGAGLRILSVESVTQPADDRPNNRTAQIIKISEPTQQKNLHLKKSFNKSLSFQDREYH
ncbi:MAG: hypothetical protein MUR51_01045 [Pseudomonadota bacterium]|nr:hypothetical protein [Pseudomonadota bacterium]